MKAGLAMRSLTAAVALALIGAGTGASAQGTRALRWQSVAGIVQPGNVVGSGSGATTGGPSPWEALGGHASADLAYGTIEFSVRGLVLAGGNAIGTRGPVTAVKGTLVCDADGSASGGNSPVVDTPLVELDEEGNAHFGGVIGAMPAVCASEPDVAFLVRTASGRWIAAGIVKR